MIQKLDYQEFQEHAFAVIDASMLGEIPAGLIIKTLVPRRLAASSHLMPSLIDLRGTPRARSQALFEFLGKASAESQSMQAIVLIQTSADITEMSRHWNAMQLVMPRPGRRLWLRLHDPRVLHQLLRILTLGQRKTLFGLARSFTYWLGGAWIFATRESFGQPHAQNQKGGNGSPYAGVLTWDWPRIERISLVNRALHGAAVFDASTLDSQGLLAEQLIERAVRHGLVDQADLVEFATRGLAAHMEFYQHPDVARALRPTHEGESGLSDRFALVPEHVWTGLRQSRKIQGEM